MVQVLITWHTLNLLDDRSSQRTCEHETHSWLPGAGPQWAFESGIKNRFEITKDYYVQFYFILIEGLKLCYGHCARGNPEKVPILTFQL